MSESGCPERWSVRKVCVACGKRRGGRLLDCVGDECPIVFHAKCYPFELKSGEIRNFLCPYCSFKVATLRVYEVQKKAILAKQTMLGFVGAAAKDAQRKAAAPASNHENQGNDAVPLKDSGAPADFVACAGVPGRGKEAQTQNDTSASKDGNQGNDVVPPKLTSAPADFVAGAGVSGHSKEAQTHNDTSGSKDGNQGNDEESGAPADFVADAGVSGHGKEAQTQNDTSASNDGNQGNDVVPPKVTGAPAEEGPCIENEVADAERSSLPKQSAKRVVRKAGMPIMKRKRLGWTDQEVAMLEEGVRKFSGANKNLPWKKILEFGSGTFDSTRAPIDLQNKWKNLKKRNTKESSVQGSPGHND